MQKCSSSDVCVYDVMQVQCVCLYFCGSSSQILMNAQLIHVLPMQHVKIWRIDLTVDAFLDILITERQMNVKVGTSRQGYLKYYGHDLLIPNDSTSRLFNSATPPPPPRSMCKFGVLLVMFLSLSLYWWFRSSCCCFCGVVIILQ